MADDVCRRPRAGALALVSGALTALVSLLPSLAAARSPAARAEGLFAARVWPLLSGKCLACHGADPKELLGGLDLRSLPAALRGGKSRKPSVVAGKPDASPLYLAVTRLHAGRW